MFDSARAELTTQHGAKRRTGLQITESTLGHLGSGYSVSGVKCRLLYRHLRSALGSASGRGQETK
jgi:hypothetical protein